MDFGITSNTQYLSVTGSMAKVQGLIGKSILSNNKATICLFAVFAVLANQQVYGFEWQFRPTLRANELFSDNLNLSDSTKKSGFVSEISPGVFLRGQSPWSNLSLNYRLQGLYNAEADNTVVTHQQMQMTSLFQAIPNTLYLDTSSSISQQNLTTSFIATDNISGNNHIVNNENFSISPYLTPHIGQYATGLLKVGYAGSYFDNPGTSSTTTSLSNTPGLQTSTLISDSNTTTEQARLSSGAYFNVVKWNLNFASSIQDQARLGEIRFRDYTADALYFINRKYSAFIQTGYEDNYYQTAQSDTNQLKNGLYYTVGGVWQPGLWYSFEAGLGNNSHVTMRYNPANNMSANVTYNYRNVGLNLGSSWDANLTHTTLFSNLNFRYHQDTTTVQQILSSQTIFPTGGFGSQTVSYALNLPNLTNDILIRKHAELNYSYTYSKHTYSATVFNEHRLYQVSLEQDNVYSATAGWQWQFVPTTNLYVKPNWQDTNSNVSAYTNTLYQLQVGVTRGTPIDLGRPLLLQSTLELRHIKEVSGIASENYIENRITASFYVQF